MNERKKTKKTYINIIFVLVTFLFAMPSVIYIIKNKSIYNFFYTWTWLLRAPKTQNEMTLNAIAFVLLFSAMFLIYAYILKNYKKLFKNMKQIVLLIIIISLIFMAIIPYTSTDVYSYIANGWTASHYKENPYYISVGEIVENYKVYETMYSKVAKCWRYETVVYGPLWTLICTGLSSLSFGNIDIGLIIYKIANLIIFLLCCLIIYKITKKKIWVLLFGLNPFILFEAISNVHNDIYIVLFILLAIYFTIRKKNIYFAVAFIALATAIKYFAIIFAPFIVIYYFKDKKPAKRFLYCMLCGLEFLIILLVLYLIYLKDIGVLAGLFIQQNKYSRSIFYLLSYFMGQDSRYLILLQNLLLAGFAIYYVYVVTKLLFTKEILFRASMRKYNIMMIIFTFILITSFNPWYIIWLFPTIFWMKGKMINTILNISYASQVANICSFLLYSEDVVLSIPYIFLIISITSILNLVQYKHIKSKTKKYRRIN